VAGNAAAANAVDIPEPLYKRAKIHWMIMGSRPCASTFLRASDALHLLCASSNGFTEVCSHDHHFLDAAPRLGLKGLDVIHE
jgi:hypothetical protein